MSYRTFAITAAVFAAIALLPLSASAQVGPWGMSVGQPATGTVAGTGVVTLRQAPTKVRMYVELLGKGSTLSEAIEKLKDRREAAEIQLEALGADTDSIEFGSPSLSNSASQQKKQFEQLVRQRMGSRGKAPPKGLVVPESSTVSCTLSAEWSLEGDDAVGRLVAAETLKKKVRDADIAGTKESAKLSPEEEELAAEMANMMNNYGEEEIPVGQTQFVYVARIAQDAGDKAMADAFAKAKTQAEQLAKAAGRPLGPLVGLAGQGGGTPSYMNQMHSPFGYSQREYLQRLMGGRASSQDQTKLEAIGNNADNAVFTFSVHASFRIEEAE